MTTDKAKIRAENTQAFYDSEKRQAIHMMELGAAAVAGAWYLGKWWVGVAGGAAIYFGWRRLAHLKPVERVP